VEDESIYFELLTHNKKICFADPLEESTTQMVLNGCVEQNETADRTGNTGASKQLMESRKYCLCEQKCGSLEHERIHMGENPYRYDLCDKAFRTMALLYIHKKYHFKSHESYHFQWVHCPKTFPFQSALTKRMRKHTGE
jgi:KRAB domain-containing zinc finger protein